MTLQIESLENKKESSIVIENPIAGPIKREKPNSSLSVKGIVYLYICTYL